LLDSIPAQAAQLVFVDVLAAVQLAAALQDAQAVQQCLALRAVIDAEPEHLRQLLVAVLQLNSGAATLLRPLEALCSMQNTQHLSHAMIEDVLKTAFDTSSMDCARLQSLVPLMRQLPQAQGMQLDSMLEWCSATDLYQQLVRLTQPAGLVSAALAGAADVPAAASGPHAAQQHCRMAAASTGTISAASDSCSVQLGRSQCSTAGCWSRGELWQQGGRAAVGERTADRHKRLAGKP
jgi:hypothetical protein